LPEPTASDLPHGTELSGVIMRGYGLYYDVSTPLGLLRCTLRGTLKRARRKTDPAAVGDRVRATLTTPETDPPEAVIEEVLPRARSLSRLARGTQDVEQVIVANPDQLIAVFAIHEPEPHPRLVDRFLLIAEARGLEAIICVNKVDLAQPGDVERFTEPFRVAGYPIVGASAKRGIGLDELRARLAGKVSAFAGPSGVGKSSLLNALHPAGERAVGTVSDATGKGRHTTTATRLYRIEDDPATYVADTPGIRALALHGVAPDELDRCFPEFRPYLDGCFYPDCTHLHEPGCAVRDALAAGAIPAARYESYASLRRGDSE
jgi:ribosome biogenesis GTPase / thiamine phosphate phosphatase